MDATCNLTSDPLRHGERRMRKPGEEKKLVIEHRYAFEMDAVKKG
jgi:hypothetical protein